jgi:pyruvate kinase
MSNQTSRLAHFARTKTVATIGPASNQPEVLEELILAGANVFRLNMAHGDREVHTAAIQTIRSVSEKLNLPVAILVDLAGPKIRLGQLASDPVKIETGQEINFVRGLESSNDSELTCNYEPLIDEVKTGDSIVLADGALRLTVMESAADHLRCRAADGGKIRSRQGVNLPGTDLSVPALGPVDKDNAVWACQNQVDFISISFVRNAAEVRELRELIQANGSDAHIVAKIEKREAIENLDEIVEETDVVMVARGDLGVEIDIEKTPLAQKRIIRTCLQYSKPVIVATQMLESMHSSKQPTRAEASDVANAILDGADACMLSGETAIGEFPIDAVKMMNKIMRETETMFESRASKTTNAIQQSRCTVSDAVVFGSAQIARRTCAKVVFLVTSNSRMALVKSKQRDYVPTVCITDDFKLYCRMGIYWSVVPVLVEKLADESLPAFIENWAKSCESLASGDRYVCVLDTEIMPGIHDTVMVKEL